MVFAHRTTRVVAGVLTAFVVLPGLLCAQSVGERDRRTQRAYIAQLDNPTPAVRRNAADALRAIDPDRFDDAGLTDLLSRGDAELSLEQRRLLREVLRERFFASPRGAIGVRLDSEFDGREAPVIGVLYEGFPAGDDGLLRVGDVILEIEGQATVDPEGQQRSVSRVQTLIFSHDPGEVVRLLVRRGDDADGEGDTFEVAVPLGPTTNFNGVFATDNALPAAWRERQRRLGFLPEHGRELTVTTLIAPLPAAKPQADARPAPGVIAEPVELDHGLGGAKVSVRFRLTADVLIIERAGDFAAGGNMMRSRLPLRIRDTRARVVRVLRDYAGVDDEEAERWYSALEMLRQANGSEAVMQIDTNGGVLFRVDRLRPRGGWSPEWIDLEELERRLSTEQVSEQQLELLSTLEKLNALDARIDGLRRRVADAQADPSLRKELERVLERSLEERDALTDRLRPSR